MKINIDWLRDFVPVEVAAEQLAGELTLAGLEVDGVAAVAAGFEGVVVAEILAKAAHPDADRLSICRIFDGEREHEIVCGAPNAAAGLKVPFAPVGTVLPGGMKIRAARIRGVRSEGMLCSAKELALADDSAGLLVLDAAAVTGQDLREHLRLEDHVLDIDLTPNRGDCFSVLGIAREIAARQGSEPLEEALDCIEPGTDRTFDVELVDTAACPRFAGRVIGGISPDARTPDWLRERLRRAGFRPIHPVVDVTNYVMLEVGQPLHAYRLDRLAGPIEVRFARPAETLRLLDDSELTLDGETLVIADRSGAIGLAGIMGGASTAVDAGTGDIFLESAFFAPRALQGRARRYGLHTDASVRFERGVDPSGQERAIERATALLLDIAGGTAGPVVLAEDAAAVPERRPVALRAERVRARLGMDIPDEDIVSVLERLGMQVERADHGWQVTPPSFRFDIAIEEDLIEEIGRTIGYDRIPVVPGQSAVRLGTAPEARVTIDELSDLLAARGFAEIVSFAFAEAGAQEKIDGGQAAPALANPISRDLNVMRTSLWPGLLRAARLNFSRQLVRCRLFEAGTVFAARDDGRVAESTRIAGLVSGPRAPVHFEGASPMADFYDLKGDVEALLSLWRLDDRLRFVSDRHPALSPSRSAAILVGDQAVGWIGELHPGLAADYDLREFAVLFEIDLSSMPAARVPVFAAYSRFPSMRRDLAVVVAEKLSVADLTKHVTEALGDALSELEVFDVYRGKGVDTGRKSIGIGLILQDASRTLTDDETDDMIRKVVRRLEHELGATIRT
jgi:phenylalanyl-tRNA synthetase beta chain